LKIGFKSTRCHPRDAKAPSNLQNLRLVQINEFNSKKERTWSVGRVDNKRVLKRGDIETL